MARILTSDGRRMYQISKWLGINEGYDANQGEASEMVNWKIGEDAKLYVRYGTKTIERFLKPVRGLWCGYVKGVRVVLAAASGSVWKFVGDDAVNIGALTDAPTNFFGFNDN